MNAGSRARGSIVVGLDGSPSSERALDWAVEEATRRRLPLHLVSALPADDVVEPAAERVLAATPALTVTTMQSSWGPAGALVDASETAEAVVVGARGVGRLRGLLLGSVSLQVATHALCPVFVVRTTPTPGSEGSGGVVVGVDGSPRSAAALELAFAEASSRGCELTAVHAYWMELAEGILATAPLAGIRSEVDEAKHHVLTDALAEWVEKYPDVVVQRHMISAHPVDALLELSEGKDLLVVGNRGHRTFAGALLGSVTQSVLHRAMCPVAVTHR